LDLRALKRSLQEIVNRHDALRTSLVFDGAHLMQRVNPYFNVRLPVSDLAGTDEAIRYSSAYALAEKEIETTFDLKSPPLFRFKLIRLAPEDHILICVMHHVISDGWSMGILVRELGILYGAFTIGRPSPLPPLPIQFGDYAEWHRELMSGEFLDKQRKYWRAKLGGVPPVIALCADRPRPPKQTFDGASQAKVLPQEVVRCLTIMCAVQEVTFFMAALAAFKVLLFRYSGQLDIVVGVPFAGRTRLETEVLIGFFVNTVVLRSNLSGNPRFRDLLLQVRENAVEAFCNADIPFEEVVHELRPDRNLSYNPVFQVAFTVVKAAVRAGHMGVLEVSPYVIANRSTLFDLAMNLVERGDGQWLVEIEYNTHLFNRERAVEMLGEYISVLTAIATQPDLRISDMPLTSGSEYKRQENSQNHKSVPATDRAQSSQVGTSLSPRCADLRFQL
jgi:hypothetical protein